jgi:hypothetical protein
MLMTNEELQDLTGYKSAKYQIEWLRARGWIFELNRVGRPKVDREYCRGKMGNGQQSTVKTGPNWAAM